MSERKKYGVALVGCGIVGGGTAQVLTQDRAYLESRIGLPLFLKYIIDRNFDNARRLGLEESLYEEDLNKALNDPEVFLIVELVGGLTVAKKIITKALEAKKHVVTANKALLAHYGPELFGLARKNGVTIGFEASCGGGIPIIKTLTDSLLGNRIEALFGIVNGTCNHILTEMSEKGQSYEDALHSAQKAGLAEADPTLDVTGMDSAHKIAIMSSLAFSRQINLEAIPVKGIDTLKLYDIERGKDLGYVMKLIAMAEQTDQGLILSVSPAFLPQSHPLARVSGAFNAVSVYGHALGHSMYMGRGAGSSPTASAVVADIISCALGITQKAFNTLKFWPDLTQEKPIIPSCEHKNRYYLHFDIEDKPGIVAKITSILSHNKISICSLIQKEESGPYIPLVMTSHKASKGAITKALEEITQLAEVQNNPTCLTILEEYPEHIQ